MTTKKTPAKNAADQKSRWRKRVEESRANDASFKARVKPYLYEGCTDGFEPVEIFPPRTVEQFTVLARIQDPNAPLTDGEMRDVLRILCGPEAWDRVWPDIKNEHVSLMFALIEELNLAFADAFLPSADEVDDVPGGA